jgi:hypothetical protein
MFEYDTRIWLCGTLVEVTVEYDVSDGVIEIEKANVIGVYHRGDKPETRDYTALGTDLPLWGSDMADGLYEVLVFRAEQDVEERRWEYYREA